MIFFSIRVFFHGHWRLTGQQGKGGDSTTSTRSRTFRHLVATLHVRWLSHIFNRTACIYQAATRWDLPPYRITKWLIHDVTLSFCLFTRWFDSSFFCYSNLRRETGGFELASTITLVSWANRLTKSLPLAHMVVPVAFLEGFISADICHKILCKIKTWKAIWTIFFNFYIFNPL